MAEQIDANVAVVRSFFAAITEGRFDDAAGVLDPEGSWCFQRDRTGPRVAGRSWSHA